jgi:glycosyltransferase involved in cell wall biosynthesis
LPVWEHPDLLAITLRTDELAWEFVYSRSFRKSVEMKFSVLLPTRNRLEYLRYAVETVRRQDYDDWEIIISDNFSEQDVGTYVQSLNEPRIKYFRTEHAVSVTDNWNNALNRSTGDYVVMLGDDDCLMKRYFTTALDLIQQHDQPDLIYAAALIYAYPGVLPNSPDGYLHTHPGARFIQTADAPFFLARCRRVELVRQFLDFRMMINCNMQHSLMSRQLINSLRVAGEVFQSPYPDHFATNCSLLVAERVLVDPRPRTAIGISPKSHGFYHFNHREVEGTRFLGGTPSSTVADRLRDVVLPSSQFNTSWLFAAEAIKDNFGADFDLRVGYRRYRWLQILHAYREHYMERRLSRGEIGRLKERMRLWEKVVYGAGFFMLLTSLKMVPPRHRSRVLNRLFFELTRQYTRMQFSMSKQHFSNILEVFEQADPLAS